MRFRGAEAIVNVKRSGVVKDRVSKGYRIPEIDDRLRRQRTRLEASLLAKANRMGVAVPRVFDVGRYDIRMEFLDGPTVKDVLDSMEAQERGRLAGKIGEALAGLHAAGIAHGDPTTSNMIYKDSTLYLIDFGLAKTSRRAEDQAVDLFLLHEAIKAGHFAVLEAVWANALKTYKRKYSNASAVLQQLEKIRSRRRYKHEEKTT